MTSHYSFEAESATRPTTGRMPGAENVRDARHRLCQPVPTSCNDWLEDRCKVLWGEIAHGKLPDSIAEV